MGREILLCTSWQTHEDIHIDVLACPLMGGLWNYQQGSAGTTAATHEGMG